MRGELAWSEMMVEWVLIESLAMVQVVAPFRDCVFQFFGGVAGSGGEWGEMEPCLI